MLILKFFLLSCLCMSPGLLPRNDRLKNLKSTLNKDDFLFFPISHKKNMQKKERASSIPYTWARGETSVFPLLTPWGKVTDGSFFKTANAGKKNIYKYCFLYSEGNTGYFDICDKRDVLWIPLECLYKSNFREVDFSHKNAHQILNDRINFGMILV